MENCWIPCQVTYGWYEKSLQWSHNYQPVSQDITTDCLPDCATFYKNLHIFLAVHKLKKLGKFW